MNVFGPHPTSGAEIKLMAGRFGAFVTDGTTNATLPKTLDPAELTLEQAVVLIDERAAKGPAQGKKKAPAKKPAAKKPAAKKAPVKKAAVKSDAADAASAPVAKKAPVKKAAAKKPVVKKAPAKKAPAKTAAE